MSLEAFLIWNSVIASFQSEINGSIRIALNVGLFLLGKNDVIIVDFWGPGMRQDKTVNVVFMWYNCLHKWTWLK